MTTDLPPGFKVTAANCPDPDRVVAALLPMLELPAKPAPTARTQSTED